MIITVECPSCRTSFPVDPRKVPDGGVKVRCSACSGIFFVDKPEIPEPTPAPVAAVAGAGAEEMHERDGETAAVGIASDTVSTATADTVPVDEDRDHVDPWSGSGFDHPSDMGASAGDDRADPWSGGIELDDAPATDEPGDGAEYEPQDEAGDHGTGGEAEDSGDSWVLEQSSEVSLDEPETVDRIETIADQMRSAAAEHTDLMDDVTDEGTWDETDVPPAAESPVEGAWAEAAPEPMETEADAETVAEGEDQAESAWDAPAAEAEATDEPEAYGETAAADDTEPAVEAESEPIAEAGAEADAESGSAWADSAGALTDEADSPAEAAWEEAAAESHAPTEAAMDEAEAVMDEAETVVDEAEAAVAEGPAEEAEAPAAPAVFQFGKRDPHDKARRLARVLVSDMIAYNPDRHRTALENGTLVADFEEEIRKSWAEYTEQVGSELAESTTYWFDALNEILAEGEKVF